MNPDFWFQREVWLQRVDNLALSTNVFIVGKRGCRATQR